MTKATYDYDVPADPFYLDDLVAQIVVGGLAEPTLNWLDDDAATIYLVFDPGLSGGDKTILDGIVAGYTAGTLAPVYRGDGESVVLFDHYGDTPTTHTDGTEDDLYSDGIAALTLATNGDKIVAEYTLTIASHALSTDRVRAYFGGTAILDSGSNTFASGGTANVWLMVIRESSSVVRVKAEFVPSGITLQPVVAYTRITGLTLTNAQILKLTGVATGTGSASGDIVAKMGYVQFLPAA